MSGTAGIPPVHGREEVNGPQSDRHRVVVVGHLHPHGGECTVLFVRDAEGWLLYCYGINQPAVRLTVADAAVISDGLAAA